MCTMQVSSVCSKKMNRHGLCREWITRLHRSWRLQWWSCLPSLDIYVGICRRDIVSVHASPCYLWHSPTSVLGLILSCTYMWSWMEKIKRGVWPAKPPAVRVEKPNPSSSSNSPPHWQILAQVFVDVGTWIFDQFHGTLVIMLARFSEMVICVYYTSPSFPHHSLFASVSN